MKKYIVYRKEVCKIISEENGLYHLEPVSDNTIKYQVPISSPLLKNVITKEEIDNIEVEHNKEPEKRLAQNILAREIITFLHGEEEYKKALHISESLFSDKIWELTADEIIESIKDVPRFDVKDNTLLIDLLVDNKIVSSKREAREMITTGAISINNQKSTDLEKVVTTKDAIEGKVLLIKKGKKNYFMGLM